MNRSAFFLLVFASLVFSSCEKNYVPKPHGYFRIALPQRNYRSFESDCPLSFELPGYAKIERVRQNQTQDSCWFNIYFPRFNARVHCTYVPVGNNFSGLIHEAYDIAMSHEVKATAMKRTLVDDNQRNVFGVLYDIEGEAASQLQFFLTDSTDHFFRGALYFFNKPNPDSIAPVLSFLREDVVHIAETLNWK
jgi:gliding motility-associated lipoprotein GldD